jgi:KDO2-lipid IV(A) lauroyltransferase
VAEAGRLVGELPRLWLRPADKPIADPVRWDGGGAAGPARPRPRPGAADAAPGQLRGVAQAYAERFGARQPITVLYRPARKRLAARTGRNRPRPPGAGHRAGHAGRRAADAARPARGETVGLLPDQVPPDGMGVWVPFFGQPAYTMTLAARLVQQTGAAVPAVDRAPAGGAGYVVHAQALPRPLPEPGPGRGVGARHQPRDGSRDPPVPAQYLWGYHRYKQPRQPEARAHEPGPRAVLALVWLLHWLPLACRRRWAGAGALLHALAGSRRRMALRNLELCLPELAAGRAPGLVREHFGWLGRSLLERGLLWYASPSG